MADGKLIFDTSIDESGFKSGVENLKKSAKKSEKSKIQFQTDIDEGGFRAGVANLKGIAQGIAGAVVTKKLVDAASAAVRYNAQMENYTTNFGVMLQDEAKGVEYVAKLREKAAKTPFGMEDFASASQTMLSFGMSAEKTNEAMDQLGDIALGDKGKFQSLSLAFAQISAAGKLTGQDLMQMVNAGFNPLNTLAEKTGTNLGDLKDVMSGGKGSKEFRKQMKAAQSEVKKLGENASDGAKLLAQIGVEGGISAEMVGKAMEIETSPGGRFYNGMDRASKTIDGQFSTLKDNALQLAGNVFRPVSDAIGSVLLPAANGAINVLNGLFENKSVTYTVEAQAEIQQAQNDLNTLDADVASLKEKYLRDQIAVNVTVVQGTGLAEQLEGMFEVTPKLKDWDDSAKADAIKILGKLNEMIPGFKYTPDEEGLKKLQDDLGKESEAVTNLVTEYGELEKKRNASKFLEGMQAELADAEMNAAYLAQQKQEMAAQRENAQRELDAYKYLNEQSNGDRTLNTVAGRMNDAYFENDFTYANIDPKLIAEGIDMLSAYSELGGSLNELQDMDKDRIHLDKLVDADGNLLDAQTLAGDEEAVESLYAALMALNDKTQEDAWGDGGKQEEINAIDAAISGIDAALDEQMQSVEALRAEVATAQAISEKLEGGKSLEEILADAQQATESPYEIPVGIDDQATEGIDGVEGNLTELTGKEHTVHIRMLLSGGLPDVDGSHAGGLSRVPFDGYIARLHEGEAVLTKAEASLWRAGWSGARGAGSAVSPASAGSAGGGAFSQINNFNVPVQTPDEFAKTMHLYATYGMEGVI